MDQHSDSDILKLIKEDQDKGISLLFKQYYPLVCETIFYMIKDKNLAEDIGQDVFHEFWKKKDRININTSIKAYLKRSAINKTLNHINKKKLDTKEIDNENLWKSKEENAQGILETKELETKIHSLIEKLPPKCREVFMLSRFAEMTYQEIADQMEISTKTVENQISKALKSLREGLKTIKKPNN
jgi:RNA polymerase sigma-70 factor (ECF subfamily)